MVECHWCKKELNEADAYWTDEETPYCDQMCADDEGKWLMWGAEEWY